MPTPSLDPITPFPATTLTRRWDTATASMAWPLLEVMNMVAPRGSRAKPQGPGTFAAEPKAGVSPSTVDPLPTNVDTAPLPLTSKLLTRLFCHSLMYTMEPQGLTTTPAGLFKRARVAMALSAHPPTPVPTARADGPHVLARGAARTGVGHSVSGETRQGMGGEAPPGQYDPTLQGITRVGEGVPESQKYPGGAEAQGWGGEDPPAQKYP